MAIKLNFSNLIQTGISIYLLYKLQTLSSSLEALNIQFKANALVLQNQAALLADVTRKLPSKSLALPIEGTTLENNGFMLDFLLLHGDRLIVLSGGLLLLGLGWYFFPAAGGSGFGALLGATDNAAGAAGAALNSTVGALQSGAEAAGSAIGGTIVGFQSGAEAAGAAIGGTIVGFQRGAVGLTSNLTPTSSAVLKEEILLNLLEVSSDSTQRLILHSESPGGEGGTLVSLIVKAVNDETFYSLPAQVAATAEEAQFIADVISRC